MAVSPGRAGTPVTRYAKSGDLDIAYQVVGDGPDDLVYVPGWISQLDLYWEEPSVAHFLRALGTFSRLIVFDKRGTGLSDRVPESALPTLEERMDDVRAVMDAVPTERAAIFGQGYGCPIAALCGDVSRAHVGARPLRADCQGGDEDRGLPVGQHA